MMGDGLMKKLKNATPVGCLIVVGDAVVGLDLADIIAEAQPQAEVIVVTTLGAAVAALADVASVDIAFIAAEPEDFERSSLARCLAERGGQVVLMGVMATHSAPVARWRLLPFPFSTEHVRRLIAALIGNQTCC